MSHRPSTAVIIVIYGKFDEFKRLCASVGGVSFVARSPSMDLDLCLGVCSHNSPEGV